MADTRRPIMRDADASDTPAIREIYAHHVLHGTGSFEQTPPDLDEMTRRWRTIADAELPFIVAEIEQRICGFGYAGPFRARPAYRHTVEDSVYVSADCMRLGVGSALLHTLVERCNRGRYRRMVAVVGDSANTASIRLHERHLVRTDTA